MVVELAVGTPGETLSSRHTLHPAAEVLGPAGTAAAGGCFKQGHRREFGCRRHQGFQQTHALDVCM
jgi:hypothetical protein